MAKNRSIFGQQVATLANGRKLLATAVCDPFTQYSSGKVTQAALLALVTDKGRFWGDTYLKFTTTLTVFAVEFYDAHSSVVFRSTFQKQIEFYPGDVVRINLNGGRPDIRITRHGTLLSELSKRFPGLQFAKLDSKQISVSDGTRRVAVNLLFCHDWADVLDAVDTIRGVWAGELEHAVGDVARLRDSVLKDAQACLSPDALIPNVPDGNNVTAKGRKVLAGATTPTS